MDIIETLNNAGQQELAARLESLSGDARKALERDILSQDWEELKALYAEKSSASLEDNVSADLKPMPFKIAVDDLRYDFDRPQVKLGANYRAHAVDIFGSIYYYHQDYRQYSTIEDITKTSKVFRQYGPYTMTWKHDNLTYTAGVNWQLNENHSLGVRADFTQQTNGANQVIYDEDVFENDVHIDHLYSHQTSKESKPLGWLVNTYYNGKVGELGIDFNFDYMTSGTDTNRENVEQSQVNDDFVLSKSGTNSRLYATKLVLSYPLWKGTIEAGTEMTFAKRHNTYWIDKVTIANTDADIKENNIAAFAEYGCDFAQYGNASVGLRYEHTLYDYDDTQNQNFLHRSMDEWFPTAAYSISLGKVQAALSYSIKTERPSFFAMNKTERPSFFAMNDAVTYISRYTLQAGNSQLLNERLHELTLNLSYRWLTFTASYEHTKNAITQWTYISTTQPDATLVKHVNLDKPVNTLSASKSTSAIAKCFFIKYLTFISRYVKQASRVLSQQYLRPDSRKRSLQNDQHIHIRVVGSRGYRAFRHVSIAVFSGRQSLMHS